ncbi:guanine deaminase [Saprolegnia parasitica CBS 223.65]|uniref:Guanine deaminase n=1 Tax=Saprolegnia parasitica (strain CBS 223.65) TaxID=695850 RepID=A0A067C4N5_SAPPC|nr:guanine deaminase [Saprolegnia parasitica CBS 223.65]KDO21757.1 guanine deaminase [Saprolegnia parasitica CBS 223.65]|eukprot:XP_012207558.1 guanine deaminase [Saprolegnia parasitica CBS 223.65]
MRCAIFRASCDRSQSPVATPFRNLLSATNMSSSLITAYKGVVVHSVRFGVLEVLDAGLIGTNAQGKILFVHDLAKTPIESIAFDTLVDHGKKLLVPGFVDGHAHAPQYSFLGVGMHLPLLDWLNTYTFPHEAKFADLAYATSMYTKAVTRHVRNGTTTCSYFATVHLEASKALADIVARIGQRGYIGKVNMDRHAPPSLAETTSQSLADTKAFIEHVLAKKDDLVTPVITPRFVPSTTSDLMHGLAALSKEQTPPLPVQSHLSENGNEIAWVKDLHPDCDSYADVYHRHGLLHDRSYMAHCIWCSGGERKLLKETGTGIVHCPNSNFSLTSGVLNVRRCLRDGLKVGLGTDVSAGYTTSMLDAVRNAVIASKLVSMGHSSDNEEEEAIQEDPLTFAEAFHLATIGGAEVLNLQDKVGNFVPGKDLDMLVVDLNAADSPVDEYATDDALHRFQKFLFVGDDRNITSVYVRGRQIHAR